MNQHELPNRTGTSGGSLSRVLRTLAGAPAAWRAKRRGSFLVLVVGTLALLSVFAILYVSIGNQDLRMKGANDRRVAMDDVPQQVARYIANDIIAQDALARWFPNNEPDPAPGAIFPLGWREAFDYPSISWTLRSNGMTSSTFFNPVGTMDRPEEYRTAIPDQFPDRWLPTDPWLASLEPTWLNFNGGGLDPGEPFYNRNRDWAQISNIAPDGRFVNLANLRNNFDAQPGVGADDRGLPRLSSGLTLFRDNGSPDSVPDFGGAAADPNTPAYWTARQRGAFRPLSMNVDVDPDDPVWPQYQWADADGDGMLDSRWFSMTDYRGQAPGQLGGDVIDLLETDGSIRYFFAARIVDLSGLVNVNTAGDFRAPPDWAFPAGFTGGDIDLHRLLTLRDRINDDQGLALDSSYDGLYNAPNASDVEKYNGNDGYKPDRAFFVGTHAYSALRLGIESRVSVPGRAQPGQPGQYTVTNGLYGNTAEGQYEYDMGIREIPGLTPPAPGRTFLDQFRTIPGARSLVFDRQSGSGATGLMYTGNFLGSYLDDVTPVGQVTVSGAFGLADLAELLTYRATNDPAVTSAFESTVGAGRDDTVPGDPSPTMRLSTLRTNRALGSEADRDFDNRAQQTLLHFAADVRQRLTTISGAREFRNARNVSADEIRTSELKIDARRALGNGSRLFAGYVRALAGEAKTGLWNTPAAGAAPEHTLFYGYNGPELAVYTAGFMAANAVDAFDSGSSPTSFTLVTDRSYITSIDAADDALPKDQQVFPAAHANRKMDITAVLGANSIADTNATGGGDTPVAPAVNIFGIEAQPFITQVTTFTVYTDAPSSAGGNDEGSGENIDIEGAISEGNPDFLYRVVAFQLTNPFGTSITLSSGCFNDERNLNALSPSFPPIDREDGFYYIEFGGKYYKLASLREQTYYTTQEHESRQSQNPPLPSLADDARAGQYTDAEIVSLHPITIDAGKSITVYSISQIPRRVLKDRVAPADPNLPSPDNNIPDTIHDVIKHNLGAGAVDFQGGRERGVYWIPEFDQATGRIDLPTAGNDRDPLPTTAQTVNLYRAVRLGDATDPGEGNRQPGNVPTFWDGSTQAATNPVDMYTDVNKLTNDRLMDRFRVEGDLDRKLPAGDNDVNGTDYDDPNDDSGFTIALWANSHRPRDPGTGGTPNIPVGAFPAYCMEPKYVSGWNVGVDDQINVANLQRSDFTGNDEAATTIQDWRNAMRTTTIADLPSPIAPNNFPSSMPKVGDAPRANPLIPDTANYQQHYAEIVLPNGGWQGNNATASAFRLGDLLLPLGIGPCEKPVRMDLTLETDLRLRWTTLGEAMASALGYENTTIPDPANEVMSLYTPLMDPAGSGELIRYLDRGCLKLDKYVPFLDDVNTNGLYDAGEERRGLQIPPAMAIFDEFSVQMPFDQTAPANALEKAGLPMRQGVVNINTAPLPVARCLPMLSPIQATDPAGDPWWWWTGAGSLNDTSDIAATVLSYRDKKDERLRPQSAAGGPPTGVVTFVDLDLAGGGQTIPPNVPYDQLTGRQYWTSIAGINEQPGFRTVGELLAAQIDDGTSNAAAYTCNMRFLGHDMDGANAQNNFKKGVTPTQYNVGGTPTFDTLANEYKEQLTVFQGAANTMTTRSDVFACWFVVHGYKKSDVENLKPEDPIVPSVKRRFLMIVDRSKVVKRGDKAEILLMKEVPYQPQ